MKVLALQSQEGALELLAEMAWHYSSQIAKNRTTVFLEIEKSGKLFSSQQIVEGLQRKALELGLPLRMSLGRSPAEAWAFLHFNVTNKMLLPLEALQIYLDPFQQQETSKIMQSMLLTFRRLGFSNFSDFERCPRSGVASRFGAEGLWALQRVDGDQNLPWPLWKPEEVIQEVQTFDPDQRVQSLQTLNFILRPLIERMMARLSWRHEALTQLYLALHLENFSVVKDVLRFWTIPFSFPQTQLTSILNIIKEKLELELRTQPLESSVIFVELKVLDKAPRPDRQKDFFSKKEEDLEMEAALISRLHQKMGPLTVFRAATKATYRPESSWQKLVLAEKELIPLPLRPLILFKRPKRLRKLGPYLIFQNQRFRVRSWQGPERISSEWWTAALQRQYWVVDIEVPTREAESCRWWVYTDLLKSSTENLFLHGVFD